MTIDKSTTTGATTTRIRLTEHGTAHITETCGQRLREIYVPVVLLRVFMEAHSKATGMSSRPTASISEAAEMARVSRRTIYYWIAADKVEHVRTASGSIRVFVDTLWQRPRREQEASHVA